MVGENALQLKEKIIYRIRNYGPSLPVQIAKEIGTNSLFASAFLSELISEKRLKVSNLKVGSSPLYYIPGQEELLEKFSSHLNHKEKEAYELLKNKKILRDASQEPAIRIALTQIKDFAIPFKKDGQLYWKYLTLSDQELIEKMKNEIPIIKHFEKEIEKEIGERQTEKIEEEPKKEIKQKKPEKIIKKKIKKKATKRKATQKKNDKFFNSVKEFLSKKSIEILDIEGFSKDDLRLKIKIGKEERFLVAYNKKRISEEDLIKAHKKASEIKLKYMILTLGKPLKKLETFIEAIKNLTEIKTIE